MSDDRTEPATPKRRREARKKGQVARSAELPMAVSLGLAVALAPTVARKLAGTLQVEWPLAISQASRATPQAALALFGRISREALFALMPLVAGIAAASVIAQLALVGAQPNLHNLVPKLNRLDPRQGLKRLVSKQALWELGRNLAKLALLALVVYGTWRSGLERLMAGSGSLDSFLATLGAVVSDLLHRAALVAALIGVVDAVVAKRRHRRVIRMTKQEVKEESKQSEGNPQVKSAI